MSPPVGAEPAAAPPRRRRWRLKLLLVLALLLALAYAGRAFLLAPAAHFLDVSEPPQRTDYVMVLGGGDDTRPFVAAALYKRGLAGAVLVPEPGHGEEGPNPLMPVGGEAMRRVLAARGVPERDIHSLPGEVGSTYDEACALNRFLDSHPEATVTIVTNTFHTRRAGWIFRKVLGNRAGQLHVVGAPVDGFDADNWWHHEAGVGVYTHEFGKLAVYWVRY